MKPSVNGVLETALYVADTERSAGFYRKLFGFETLVEDERLCALSVAGRHVLLLIREGGSKEPTRIAGGVIPPSDAAGQMHAAFSIEPSELDAWAGKLEQHGIAIESTVRWERGGTSLYFRDPDGHLLELATPGVWAIY